MILYECIAGSHMWGLNSHKSDTDIRFIFQEPTHNLIKLYPPKDTQEYFKDDRKKDYQGYEIAKFFRMLNSHNGNAIRLLSCPPHLILQKSIEIPWDNLKTKFLTKRLVNYYEGFSRNQKNRGRDNNRGGKSLLYTYRELMEGIALFETGTIIFSIDELYEYIKRKGYYSGELFTNTLNLFKVTHEYIDISLKECDIFENEWNHLVSILRKSCINSNLPETYDGERELNDILLSQRLKYI